MRLLLDTHACLWFLSDDAQSDALRAKHSPLHLRHSLHDDRISQGNALEHFNRQMAARWVIGA